MQGKNGMFAWLWPLSAWFQRGTRKVPRINVFGAFSSLEQWQRWWCWWCVCALCFVGSRVLVRSNMSDEMHLTSEVWLKTLLLFLSSVARLSGDNNSKNTHHCQRYSLCQNKLEEQWENSSARSSEKTTTVACSIFVPSLAFSVNLELRLGVCPEKSCYLHGNKYVSKAARRKEGCFLQRHSYEFMVNCENTELHGKHLQLSFSSRLGLQDEGCAFRCVLRISEEIETHNDQLWHAMLWHWVQIWQLINVIIESNCETRAVPQVLNKRCAIADLSSEQFVFISCVGNFCLHFSLSLRARMVVIQWIWVVSVPNSTCVWQSHWEAGIRIVCDKNYFWGKSGCRD